MQGATRFLISLILAILCSTSSQAVRVKNDEKCLKTSTFLSPMFQLDPGSVTNKYFFDIDFQKGHIAIKGFDSELVDEAGNSIPLHETYLHHWVVLRYYRRKDIIPSLGFNESDYILLRNSGVCEVGRQYFGLGSETRKTNMFVPDPYGIEVGNPTEVPEGYVEGWMLNVHAIDTRGVEDKLGCIECKCSLFNVTEGEDGKVIEKDYIGGLRCCYDGKRCPVKEGFKGIKRGLYLKYTVKYVDWDSFIVPVKIYIFDVTDTWKRSDETNGAMKLHNCKVEYNIESCSTNATNVAKDKCVHTKSVSVSIPSGGDLIYGYSHQHTGGMGSTLYGEDGRVICSSLPIYGTGTEAGDEAGYIVGMTSCYHRQGAVKIAKGEMLTFVSNYNSSESHTGVMGIFYTLVAEPLEKHNPILLAQQYA